MLTLFHAPRSRSSRIIWLLEELGVEYRIAQVDIHRKMTGTGARDPLNPHPDGQVPALLDDDVLVTESVAIVLYLTDRFPGAGLGPAVGDPLRGAYLTWLAWYAGVVEPALIARVGGHALADPECAAIGEAMDRRLTGALANGDWLLGDRFTAVDMLIATVIEYARSVLPADAAFDRHLARCMARPAHTRADAKDGTL